MAARSSAEPLPDTSPRAPYLPFEGGRFRLTMGLMPLKPAQWLEFDDDLHAHLAEKRALLAERRGDVFAALPAAAAPASELLALLAQHLPLHHPLLFQHDGDRLRNTATGESWDMARPALHPLDLCGRLTQEDFCLLTPGTDGPYILVGATVCAPARWILADKIGQPLATVHAPVPGYAQALETQVDRFFAQLKPDRLVWRINWGISNEPARFQPVAAPDGIAVTAHNAGETLWLRVERQTLRRLPMTSAIVFTIRTYITRLDAAIVTAASATELGAALRDMPPDSQRYKHIAPYAEALLAWLDARTVRT